MDCYVELKTPKDAEDTFKRINRIYETGRNPRLGNRHVDVELANQNMLLKDLFPRAKSIEWINGVPCYSPDNDPFCASHIRFFTGEEITLAIRHAEIPQRVSICSLTLILMLP